MSLAKDVQDELFLVGLYFDDQELATWRSFVISDGTAAGTLNLWMPVFWDTDLAHQRGIELAPSGIFLADVLFYSRSCDWPKEPVVNTYLESPRTMQYEIIRVSETDGIYEISLRGPQTNY